MIWGDPIEVRGTMPSWLGENDLVNPKWEEGYYGNGVRPDKVVCMDRLTAIRLPADHFAYFAIAKGYQPWGGGDEAPDDWDGTDDVILRSGDTGDDVCVTDWRCDGENWDIIGYRKRQPTDTVTFTTAPATDATHVSVKRMTEAEVIDGRFRQYSTYGTLTAITEAFRDLGLIREPTQAETIAAKTGLTVNQVQSVLDEVNNGTR